MPEPHVYVGTSGFSYEPWYGAFYPKTLPKDEMLPFYATRFDACEINNTFYRMPKPGLVKGWAKQVPKDFSLVLKMPGMISGALPERDLSQPMREFSRARKELGASPGPVLVQLNPKMKKDLARLDVLLGKIPRAMQIAVEVGDAWLSDDVLALLRDRGASLVTVDDVDRKLAFEPTSSIGYVRLRRARYSKKELERWALRIKEVTSWSSAYVFFKHDDAATGPRLGQAFRAIVAPNARALSHGRAGE